VSVGSSPGPTSGKRLPLPGGQRDALREQIIDAALEVFARQGYDATTAEQIAAEAGVSDDDFGSYFTTPESVLMSIVDDLSHGTAAALAGIEKRGDPVRALMSAGTAMATGVVDGRGPIPVERLVAMARVVSSTRNLHRKVSAARRRVLTQPLADWMGVDPDDRTLQRALTMWSAVTASAYVTATDMPEEYEPQHDSNLRQRMISNIAQSFGEVMGDDPEKP
jgi:AcrR family transcriptional regulator